MLTTDSLDKIMNQPKTKEQIRVQRLETMFLIQIHWLKLEAARNKGTAQGSKVMLSASRLTDSNSTEDRYLSPKLGKITYNAFK